MTEKERMLSGKLYNPYKINHPEWVKARTAMEEFNACSFREMEKGMQLLKEVFAHMGENSMIVPPIYYDHGWKISVGDHFFANTGFLVLDIAPVTIGNNVYIAPRVSIYTAAHPIDANVRNTDLEYALPVTIGDNVWIGGNVTINPGVTIGSNVVIGSGSVVTKDIESNVVAAGNPCRVIRPITEADKEYWTRQYQDYQNDPDCQ